MNIAIITGASSGLGKEFALQLTGILHKTDEIWLLARREEPLKNLTDGLNLICKEKNKGLTVRAIPMNLKNNSDINRFSEVLRLKEAKITALVNCAGTGLYGMFSSQNNNDILDMIALNVTALTEMTRICLPYMKKGSRIIQLASAAAFCPQCKFAVYAAAKAYVYSFGRSLAKEVKKQGIYVTVVCPGAVDTPFLAHAYGNKERPFYKKLVTTKADKVVRQALLDSKRRKKLSIYGMPMKMLYGLTRGLIG